MVSPVLSALLAVAIWTVLFGFLCAAIVGLRRGVARVQQLHSIPCSNCKYFTDQHYLKCPLHPKAALTEQAIDCLDFEPERPSIRIPLAEHEVSR